MSYLVLARKYRPKTFSEMVGQEHVVQALTNALTTQRLHHAYMFTGTRGVGKTTVSRILAKSLNCTGPDGQGGITATPCGVCQSCREIDAGRFVDYIELDAASNRGVDEVQGLLEQAIYKPVQGRFKVFMIDEVHMLTNTAFNAMLKTLEEPPEYLKFVLATTDPQKVPVTVLSRCLQFNLRPMAPETVLAHLQKVLAAEQVPADAGALHLLARAARGSMRDALSLTDQAIAFSAGQGHEGLQLDAVRQMLGSVDSSYVFQLLGALADGQAAQVLGVIDALRMHGLSAAHTLEDMARVLQRMAVWQMAPGAQADPDNPDEIEIQRLAGLMPVDETQLLYSICLHGRQELGLAPDEYAALVMVLLRLLAFKQPAGTHPSAALPTAAPQAEKKTLNRPESSPPASVPASSPAPIPPTAGAEPIDLPVDAPVLSSKAPEAPRVSVQPSAVSAASLAAPASPVASPVRRQAAAAVQAPVSVPPWEDLPPEAQADEAVPTAAAASAAPSAQPSAAQSPSRTVSARSSAPEASDAAEPSLALPVVEMPPPRMQPAATREVCSAPPPSASGAPEASAPAARRVLPTELGDVWHSVAGQVLEDGLLTGIARELLLQSQLMAQATEDGGADVWSIRVESETLQHEASRKRLEQALAQLGHTVQVRIELGRVVDTPALRLAEARRRERQEAEAIFRAHPFVQAMMRDFGAQPDMASIGYAPDAPPAAKGTAPDRH